jgi:hypothetical protein
MKKNGILEIILRLYDTSSWCSSPPIVLVLGLEFWAHCFFFCAREEGEEGKLFKWID